MLTAPATAAVAGLNCWVECVVADCMRTHDMQAAESEASGEEEKDDSLPLHVVSRPEYKKAKDMLKEQWLAPICKVRSACSRHMQ
jgi:hypothetical protein